MGVSFWVLYPCNEIIHHSCQKIYIKKLKLKMWTKRAHQCRKSNSCLNHAVDLFSFQNLKTMNNNKPTVLNKASHFACWMPHWDMKKN